MAFTRIGTPVDLSVVDFTSKEAYPIVCPNCNTKVGDGYKRLAKFAGTNTVVVSPREFICHKCGTKSPVKKK